jgi:uncharacterized protein YjdB
MKKKFRYITYILAGIALVSAIFLTSDKIAGAANKVYLNETDLTLETGHYRTLKVYGTNEKPTFKSANNRAATVSSNGKVTAMGWGSTTIYTYVGNKTLKTKVNIVQMSNKNLALSPGKTYQLALWGSDNSTTWKSSNKSVATVSDNGLVTAVGNGTATITATFNGKKITSTINVLGLNKDYAVLEYGGRFTLTRANFGNVVKLKIDGSNGKITWTSSNIAVATVDSNGKVTSRGPGKAVITANVNGLKLTADIKVLKMQDSLLELSVGDTYKLNVLGTDSEIEWVTLNKSVVTVDENGLVTAVGKGSTKIKALVDGIEIRSIITVK